MSERYLIFKISRLVDNGCGKDIFDAGQKQGFIGIVMVDHPFGYAVSLIDRLGYRGDQDLRTCFFHLFKDHLTSDHESEKTLKQTSHSQKPRRIQYFISQNGHGMRTDNDPDN